MIILKHLTIERFRLLQEVNLHFPQRGSILIQGPNEAGKSTLFESIYFALYGESLASDRGRSTLDDLILYGAPNATVTLTLLVGATELMITRTIERGKGQRVVLYVRRLGMPEEGAITRLGAANERIISELGRMDSETLRNSCFIEQKGLNRLENLHGSEREATLRKLLGLEKLYRMTEQFKLTENDERLLTECAEHLKLAEIQARIPELSTQLGQLEAALDAVAIAFDLAEVSQQEAEIAEQELSLEQIEAKRSELKGQQGRVLLLKKADAVLGEIIEAYDAMAEARQELPEIERQIAELERREREELPALEQRVSELGDLTHSFGTLERLSNDLLTMVSTIKELEKGLKQHEEVRDDLKELDEQIIHERLQVEQARQTLHELEERRRAGRPQLEARLQRLQSLAERLTELRRAEEQYAHSVLHQGLAEENSTQLKKVKRDLQETEQELVLVEKEARQTQQKAEALEKRWRQLSIARHLEEWQRLKGLSQGLAEAEQHVMAAHEHQERLTIAALAARRITTKHMGLVIACIVLFLLSGGAAALEAFHQIYVATGAGMLAILLAAGAGLSLQNYNKAREEEKVADRQMQEAISQVGMMVAAREAAVRMGGNHDALAQIEHEIRSLGGTIPQSLEEGQHLLEQTQDQGESVADIQQQMTERRDSATAARNQVNVTMEAVAALRKERARLEEQRKADDWDDIEAKLLVDQAALERLQQEVALLAGQEGLAGRPSFERPGRDKSGPYISELAAHVEDTIRGTEREVASLEGKLDVVSDLVAQIKIYQDALDVLLTRRQVVMERRERFQTQDPAQQVERAREQQVVLRSALQSLQDSLRQRVKPLGVAFGQTAISNAEAAARKQLEALHITLGNRLELQSRRTTYISLLKERQESLAEHYQQLAKFSSSLGSWIVPLNPFTEALEALRTRCQREMREADEANILQSSEKLQVQESASKAKIELCRQEIEEAHGRIASMLVQRNRPSPKGYVLADIVAVWPLVSEYSAEDRGRLEEERETLEQELQQLEQQELELSTQLQTGGQNLDLAQARARMEQQERSYQTKKRGNLLVRAVTDRLMRKMLPRTEYYMQQILPLLTSGRYHDVHLTTDVEEGTASGGAFQLRVWDTAAGAYVAKSALSGGAADQLSLALRLAFAIAALPRELTAAPSFVLLDEPLSSFDQERTKALVDVVTGEILGQHFEQLLFISHSSAFDATMFPYHVYMDDGVIVESNLPAVPTLPVSESNGNSHGAVLTPVPASIAVES